MLDIDSGFYLRLAAMIVFVMVVPVLAYFLASWVSPQDRKRPPLD